MQHFILIRYNQGWDPAVPIRIKQVTTGGVIDPLVWLEQRKTLFQRYCLPSLRGQTVRDFRVILSISPATPTGYFDFLKQIDDLDIELHAGAFDRACKCSLFQRAGSELLLTTRLDNDDAIAPAFVERVQAAAQAHRNESPVLIDVWGHRFLVSRNLFIVENYGMQHASHYCSVLSRAENDKWVYECAHGDMPKAIPGMVKLKESLYTTVLHDYNQGNSAFRGGDDMLDWFLPFCTDRR